MIDTACINSKKYKINKYSDRIEIFDNDYKFVTSISKKIIKQNIWILKLI